MLLSVVVCLTVMCWYPREEYLVTSRGDEIMSGADAAGGCFVIIVSIFLGGCNTSPLRLCLFLLLSPPLLPTGVHTLSLFLLLVYPRAAPKVIEDLRLNFSAGMFGADLVHQLEVHLHGLAVLRSEVSTMYPTCRTHVKYDTTKRIAASPCSAPCRMLSR